MPLIVCKDNKKVRKKKRSLCKITWTKRKSGKLKPYFTITFLNLESQTCPTNSSIHGKRSYLRGCGNVKPFGKRLSPSAEMPNLSGNNFRQARKCQTFRETTFASRGNAKPFGKWLSPAAEMPNLSGNDFRQARKRQTFRETTFAMRGNAKPFGKWLSPAAEMPNLLKSDLREARKRQNL